MKATKSIMGFVAVMLMAGVVVMFSACENDKDKTAQTLDEAGQFGSDFDSEFDSATDKDEELSPVPSSAAIATVGDVKTFRVTGGKKPYTWSVGTAAAGKLDKTTTANEIESVKYTATALAANTIIVTDWQGRGAVIEITAGTKTLSISPTSVTFLATELGGKAVTVQFDASGGVSSYTWSDSLPTYGEIDSNGLWTSKASQSASSWSNKTVTITLKDSNGDSATAIITAN